MRRLFYLTVLSAAVVFADQAGDIEAIRRVLTAPAARQSAAIQALPELDLGPKVWPERTAPRFELENFDFITPAVAHVKGANVVEIAPGVTLRTPVLFVLKKGAGGWSIVSARLLGPMALQA